MSKKIIQRPYQIECEKAIEEAGNGRHLVVLATGLGKTVIFTHLEGMGRTLILSHRDELVRQPEKYYEGRVTFGVEKAGDTATDEDVVSASVQSLMQDSRLNKYQHDAFETIIVDEAHHAAAPSYQKILKHFSGAKRILGFTATPKRGDRVGLQSAFDDIIFTRDIRWGIKNGYLSRIRCEQVHTNYSLDGITKTNGDYSASQLEAAFEDKNARVIPLAAEAYVKKCHNTNKHTLIYCCTKNISQLLCETIQKLLPDSEKGTVRVLLGDTPGEERANIIKDFSEGTCKCIVNCMVLTEGTDLPICDAVMNLRPTCNNSLYQQMVGRGTRLYDNKAYCLVLDVVPEEDGGYAHSLCTAPTLFGLDPSRLSKEQAKNLNEETDLLSFCDGLSSLYAKESTRMELLSKEVDLFIEECEPMFTAFQGKDIAGLVEDYNNLSAKKQEGIPKEFDGLSVEVFADDAKKYRVKPTWNSEIWFSEPDILGNTIVQFAVVNPCITAKMPLEKAVEVCKMYCETKPSYYAYSWSTDAQSLWKSLSATPNQYSKLKNEYKKLDINVRSDSNISKLDASRLIDLHIRYKEAKSLSESITQAKSGKKTKKATNAKATIDALIVQRSKGMELSPDAIVVAFLTSVRNEYEHLRNEEDRKKTEEESLRNQSETSGTLIITLPRFSPKNTKSSSAQQGFIRSLQEKSGILRNVKSKDLTMRQANLMISFLLRVNDYPKEQRKYLQFPDAINVIKSAEYRNVEEDGLRFCFVQKRANE